MNKVTMGNLFKLSMPVYGIFLYRGILLTFISVGMIVFGTIKKKEKKYYNIWFIILGGAGVLLLVPVMLAKIMVRSKLNFL